jgi:hypothetical protein
MNAGATAPEWVTPSAGGEFGGKKKLWGFGIADCGLGIAECADNKV